MSMRASEVGRDPPLRQRHPSSASRTGCPALWEEIGPCRRRRVLRALTQMLMREMSATATSAKEVHLEPECQGVHASREQGAAADRMAV